MEQQKQMCESEETFNAYATIDAAHWMLKKYMVIMINTNPLSPEYKQVKINMKECIEDLIEAKKSINADFSKEQDLLDNLVI